MTIPGMAVIADDLTGALDASAPFAGGNMRVCVAVRPEAMADVLASGADIVAVSTRSREIPADAARDRVARVLDLLPPGTRIMKKIDSRLKGNIAAELSVFGRQRFAALPAIPEFGRLVRNGAVCGFGVDRPIPIAPVLGTLSAEIPDVVTEADMDIAVGAVDNDTVLIGARGLAQALARKMGIRQQQMHTRLDPPACFAVGSNDPITLAQIDALRKAAPEIQLVQAPSGELPLRTARGDGVAARILQIVPGSEKRRDHVAKNFARSIGGWIEDARSVLLTGGATAEAIFDALGIDCLHVDREVLPGLPLCKSGERLFVTKSGGFGDERTFLRLLPSAASERYIA